MGEVFLGQDRLLNRPVAIKILHPEYARDALFIQRFRREAQAAAKLNDPRVVSIFDWGSDDGLYFLVMEFVQGRTLRGVLDDGALTPTRAAEICLDVCSALESAHEHGLVHRDIKPANIMISNMGEIKVMDFGIARAARDADQTVTQIGTILGTTAYISPEAARGLPVDSRSDVYSTAVVLYEMLTGVVPFDAENPVGVAYKHVTETEEPPSLVNPEVPPELDAIVMKGLAKNRDNRYSSPGEMRDDLKRWLNGEQVEATPVLMESQPSRANENSVSVSNNRTRFVEPGRKRRRGVRAFTYFLTFLMFLGVLVGSIALAFSLVGSTEPEPTVAVPNVEGKHVDEASQILKSLGLHSEVIRREFSENVHVLHVISHEPGNGRNVSEGSTIGLVVSKGTPSLKVPGVIGLTEEEAKKQIAKAGLEPEVKSAASSEVEAGRVLSQDPEEGKRVERGSTVLITVSSGKAKTIVPDVRGFSEVRAKELLLDRNLNPVVKKVCNTSQEDDHVISQDPQPNSEVRQGSNVTLTVNDIQSVPSVVGQSEKSATDELRSKGFAVEVRRRFLTPGKQDFVVMQSPGEGENACPGDTVVIEVED